MKVKRENEEVIFTSSDIATVNQSDIKRLKQLAAGNKRRRIRLCAHPDVGSKTHEMIIVHAKDAYVRPHQHIAKSESFHVIEGSADIVLFTEEGEIHAVIRMGDYFSQRIFYYRVSSALYHTLLIRSDMFVFHESTSGPFVRADTMFAPWAPAETEEQVLINDFLHRLKSRVESYFSHN